MDHKIMELTPESEDFLQHFGVLGMKWGVRKDRTSGGGKNSSKSKLSDEDKLKADIKRAKKVIAGYLVAAGGLKLAQIALQKKHEKMLMNNLVDTMIQLDAKRAARSIIHL